MAEEDFLIVIRFVFGMIDASMDLVCVDWLYFVCNVCSYVKVTDSILSVNK